MTNKGFSLLSVILVLFVISSFLVLTINNYVQFDDSYLVFINDYLYKQNDSIVNRRRNNINEIGNSINSTGHINRAQTINKGNHKIILHIGNGYLTYE